MKSALNLVLLGQKVEFVYYCNVYYLVREAAGVVNRAQQGQPAPLAHLPWRERVSVRSCNPGRISEHLGYHRLFWRR